ncbi:MAG: DUF937 domain-containing protein [Bryobacterales bacterium]|nr:DUF937 domain-containing protein [Bryobacterales bacterium]
MNPILDLLMNAAGGGAMQQVGQRFGLSGDQAGNALGQLVPALMAGLQRNTAQEGGMEALLGALTRGNHAQYLENPELLGQEATLQDGNAILGHILGSKDVSRAVAGQAAEQTGIGVDILKKMLPVVATMVMGGLSRQASSAPEGGGGLLASLLDQNRSGSAADDIVGFLGNFLGRR